jgi:hypothetical protein
MHFMTGQRAIRGEAGAPLGYLFDNPIQARNLARLFLGSYPLWCQRLERAVANADQELLRKVAYDIRCGCSILCATACIDLARQLQGCVFGASDRDIRALSARLEADLRNLARLLRPVLADGDAFGAL